MNNNNILSEGFFDKLFKIFKVDKSTQSKIKKDKKIKDGIKALNNSWSKIEDNLKEKGVEVKFEAYDDVPHAWHNSAHVVPNIPETLAAIDLIGKFFHAHCA